MKKPLSKTLEEENIAFSFPIEIKDSNGNKTYHENYDGSWYRYEYNSNGNETYHEDSDGEWFKAEYDADGNQTYYEDSDGEWRKREYDSNGNETYYENSAGFWFKCGYDSNGRETYYEDSDGEWFKCGYDSNGKETYFENSDGYWFKAEYNANGNQTYLENSDGKKSGTPKAQHEGIHEEKITVIDQWKTRQDEHRLVDKGEGPIELQFLDGGKWTKERPHFSHSTLCHRIKSLANGKDHAK